MVGKSALVAAVSLFVVPSWLSSAYSQTSECACIAQTPNPAQQFPAQQFLSRFRAGQEVYRAEVIQIKPIETAAASDATPFAILKVLTSLRGPKHPGTLLHVESAANCPPSLRSGQKLWLFAGKPMLTRCDPPILDSAFISRFAADLDKLSRSELRALRLAQPTQTAPTSILPADATIALRFVDFFDGLEVLVWSEAAAVHATTDPAGRCQDDIQGQAWIAPWKLSIRAIDSNALLQTVALPGPNQPEGSPNLPFPLPAGCEADDCGAAGQWKTLESRGYTAPLVLAADPNDVYASEQAQPARLELRGDVLDSGGQCRPANLLVEISQSHIHVYREHSLAHWLQGKARGPRAAQAPYSTLEAWIPSQ